MNTAGTTNTRALPFGNCFHQVRWWRVLVILVAAVLAAAVAEQPYRERQNYHQLNSRGEAYRWSADGQIEYWRPHWDRVYLEGVVIALSAGATLAIGSKAAWRLRRSHEAVLGVAIGALLLTCLFPPVLYADRSDIPKPGEKRAYQTPDGVWMSGGPILPDFVQTERFLLSNYIDVRWRPLALEWTGIIILSIVGLASLSLRTVRASERSAFSSA